MNESYTQADSLELEEAPSPATEPVDTGSAVLNKRLEQVNIASELDAEVLEKMGNAVYDGYQLDLHSKNEWSDQVDEWVKLAAQVKDEKNYPWPKASNIKYPLLATAAMQFAARAYPSLVPADGKVVQFKVVGTDMDGRKAGQADKLAKHMNYQLIDEMDGWEEDMDRLLLQLAIVGCLYKKTYFDPLKKKNCSRLIGPKDLVVNHWATSLEDAYRKTEIIAMTKNDVKSYQTAGVYLEKVELPEPRSQPPFPNKTDVHGNQAPSRQDESTPYVILEQHTFWDLDDDGYAEPYIITIEESSKKVLRVVARFDSDGIHTTGDGDVILVEPVEYYTKYGFIPNPDGGFHDIGFGHLLGPLNESANTLINILVDSGHLATLQAGFIGKGLRMKMGENSFKPGEWKPVNATGDDIKKQIFPLPVKEPSDVLFKLLGMVIESGRELASVAEIFTGKMPGQNTPATTTQATIEQGMKVFTAIYKRTYRSLTREFKKIFRLNSLYDENFERAKVVLDEPIVKEDYDRKAYDVCPTADPTAVSTTQKMLKAELLMQAVPLGLNMDEVKKRILEAQEQPNIQALLTDGQGQPIQPPPDPKMAEMQAKSQMEQEKHQLAMAVKKFELQMKQQEAMMDQKFMQMEAMMEMKLKEMEFQQKAEHQVRQSQIDMMTGQQDMQHSQAHHLMKMQQMEETANAKREQRSMAGMAKPSGHSANKERNKQKN